MSLDLAIEQLPAKIMVRYIEEAGAPTPEYHPGEKLGVYDCHIGCRERHNDGPSR